MITDKEAREAVLKLKKYCKEYDNCARCVFEYNCIDNDTYPADWCVKTEEDEKTNV